MGLRFDGRVAIVTGAGGALGRSHALELARRGARVVVNDVGGSVHGVGEAKTPAQHVVDEIAALGGEAIANFESVSSVAGGQAGGRSHRCKGWPVFRRPSSSLAPCCSWL